MVSTVGMLAMYQKLIDHAKKSAADAGKTASKGAIQKTAEAIYDLIGNKIVDVVANSYNAEQGKSQKIHNKIIQKQLQTSTIRKYLKKNIYPQKKYKKILIWD